MILGRPTNLWLGAATALFNVIVVAAHTVPGLEQLALVLNETLVATINIAVAAVIALVAFQPPTVVQGGTVKAESGTTFLVETPNGTPNTSVTA